MTTLPTIHAGALVLYKSRPAIVARVGDKIELLLDDGSTVRVRRKDANLLHPGPVERFDELRPETGDAETARDLCAGGGAIGVRELAELVYGRDTPSAAWAAWQLVLEGLHFVGSPQAIRARTAEEVAHVVEVREAKQAERTAWVEFLERVHRRDLRPDDTRFVTDAVDVALGRGTQSRLLRELDRPQTREDAHATLAEIGWWSPEHNPHPDRAGVPTGPPDLPLPDADPDEDRRDLTGLAAFAIDDEGNLDPDDAVSFDGERLWVHVADVAAAVTPRDAVDDEARDRGASLYLPEGTVPMLPSAAVDRFGLGLTETSPALSFAIELDPDGDARIAEITPARVRVQRLTYAEAEERLHDGPLAELDRVTDRFETFRVGRGAIPIDLPEVKIDIGPDGAVQIAPLPRTRSRVVVREAMMMAGAAVARWAEERGLAFPYTTQEAPQPPGDRDGLAGMYAVRRSLRPARSTAEPATHAGVGLEFYSRVTSPLRRYGDLLAHHQIRALLRGTDPLHVDELLERLARAGAAAIAVRRVERASRLHWTLLHLQRHPRWQGEGVVVDFNDHRAAVLVPEFGLETRIHFDNPVPLNSVVPLTVGALDIPRLFVSFRIP